ncbi:MAG TPA: hypothetical protein VII78_10340 [Myxococcota bacterium]|jgi:hypothetical protein
MMYRKFLTARSPLRVLEKGLHGGLGKGNVGLVLAGPGVGKSSFLVGVALDDLLRGDRVLHVVLDQTVAHTRAHYDTVFAELRATTKLEDGAAVQGELEHLRAIRAVPAAGFGAAKLREAVQLGEATGGKPSAVIIEGWDVARASAADLEAVCKLAAEIPAEIWISASAPTERIPSLPKEMASARDSFAVILALEPDHGAVALRALKDHENPNPEALRVALDPKTLLLKRS